MSEADPTTNEIKTFLDAVKKLEKFEAQQRYMRGYGVFDAKECPIPEFVKVMAWLETIALDLVRRAKKR